MFPDSSVFRVFGFVGVYTKKDTRIPKPFYTGTSTPGTFTMKWFTSCLLPRQRETKSRQEKPTGRLRQSEVSFPLAIVAHHVVSPGICPGLIQNHSDHACFRSCRS